MISWPKTLPQSVLYNGYAEETGDVRLRTPTESGPGKIRPRFSRTIDPMRCSMMLTLEQKEILKAFVKVDLKLGSLPFSFPKPQYPGETITVEIGDNMPSYTPTRPGKAADTSKPLWKVDLSLNVLP